MFAGMDSLEKALVVILFITLPSLFIALNALLVHGQRKLIDQHVAEKQKQATEVDRTPKRGWSGVREWSVLKLVGFLVLACVLVFGLLIGTGLLEY